MIMKILTRLLIPLVVVGFAVLVARIVFSMAPEAAESEPQSQAIPVEVIQVQPSSEASIITSTGLVVPAKQMTVTPEVTGRVIARSEALTPGGRLQKGDVIARIDGRDYQLALQQEESRVKAAELDLQTERGRQGVARREWELLGGEGDSEQAALALRRPHLVARKSGLTAAKSQLQRARINLSRTTIRAPWNAIVAEAAAEQGQVVSPGTKMARLIGSDQLWVKASVPLADLSAILVPGVNGDRGSEARVIHELGPGQRVVRVGHVLRLESELDSQTRLAQVIIAVDSPLDEPTGAVPLLPGSYVSIELTGRRLDDVYSIPRATVHDGDTVWIVDNKNRLARRRVDVRWGTSDDLFVSGLAPGNKVVTTNLSLPMVGAAVLIQPTRVAEQSSGSSAPEEEVPHE